MLMFIPLFGADANVGMRSTVERTASSTGGGGGVVAVVDMSSTGGGRGRGATGSLVVVLLCCCRTGGLSVVVLLLMSLFACCYVEECLWILSKAKQCSSDADGGITMQQKTRRNDGSSAKERQRG